MMDDPQLARVDDEIIYPASMCTDEAVGDHQKMWATLVIRKSTYLLVFDI
jgi:hypothetical protein